MDMITLSASARDLGMKSSKLRRSGVVPCVVYGSVDGNLHVQCQERDLHKAFAKAGESTLVELEMDGKKIPVLFKDVTLDPVSDREMHADFYAVNMKQEIETSVPVRFEGESPAVKDQAAIFVVAHDTVRVRCLPADLPHQLTANIAALANFHDVLTVKDLQVPAKVKVMDDESTVIATVQEPRAEEVIVPVVTPEAAAAGTEGAASAEGAAGEEAAKKAEAGKKEEKK